MRKQLPLILLVLPFLGVPAALAQVAADQFKSQTHPRVYATADERSALLDKIKNVPWAREVYRTLKAEVDPLVERHVTDPQFIVSRLQMNWEAGKHYTNFYTEGNFTPNRDGNAPYPTVRVAYGRSAAGSVGTPRDLSQLEPYGNGDLPVLKDGVWTQVAFKETLLGSENVNETILDDAYKAGIVYYFTSDKKYAKFAADIIWTFACGASFQNQLNPEQEYNSNGYLSFETLGDERRFKGLALAYDFIHDYLVNEYFDSDEFKNGRPGELWAPGYPQGKAWAMDRFHIMFEKLIDNKLTRGGGLRGNWNLNEQQVAMLYALALENNDQYADGKGREYYVNKLIYGPTTRGHGALIDVPKGNLDVSTGLWPEAPAGYGQGSVQQLVRFAWIYYFNGIDVFGKLPDLTKAATAFPQIAFPNGLSTGWGDGEHSPIVTDQAEYMIAYARAKGDAALEDEFTTLLNFAGDRRLNGPEYLSLFFFVPTLKNVTSSFTYPRVSYSPVHSLIFERNLADNAVDAMTYSVYGFGQGAGHEHRNGMAMELYGRGYVLGLDPGRGADYWVDQHVRYNSQVAAHNTVIPNGFPAQQPQNLKIENAEPDIVAGVDPKLQISQLCQFSDTYDNFQTSQIAADQRRVMGIVRTGLDSGYYVDIFRSKTRSEPDRYHDYLYHDIGEKLSLFDAQHAPLPLTDTPLDPKSGPAYDYFQDAHSLGTDQDVLGVFDVGIAGVQMNAWVLGNEGRTVYSLTAPPDFRYYMAAVRRYRVPTLMIRQTGEAWQRPFVAVYEPYGNGTKSDVQRVRRMNDAPASGDFVGIAVEHATPGKVEYILNATDGGKENRYEGITFKGIYAVASVDGGGVRYLYLGKGGALSKGDYAITSAGDPVSAQLTVRPAPAACVYSSDKDVTIRIPCPVAANFWVYYKTDKGIFPAADCQTGSGTITARLPAAVNAQLLVNVKDATLTK